MKERPILFNGEMVRAILEGRKTQTRRVIRPQPWPCSAPGAFDECAPWFPWAWQQPKRYGDCAVAAPDAGGFSKQMCRLSPYGQPGDRLWVRETFQGPLVQPGDRVEIANIHTPEFCEYRADGGSTPEWIDADDELHQGWRPSIHMPRWASRITLEITGVRVERLQNISEEDAVAEGAEVFDTMGLSFQEIGLLDVPEDDFNQPHRNGFALLWESINGPGSWAANPWVWVIEFKQVES